MALTINCCLKPSPPPPNSARSTLTQQWLPSKDQSDWRKKCVTAMACVLISSTVGMTDGQEFASAMEIRRQTDVGSKTRMVRWSDKRSCPPWHQNSLENIVPENLPRPLKSRRPNNVTTRKTAVDAAGDGGKVIGFDKSCFSL